MKQQKKNKKSNEIRLLISYTTPFGDKQSELKFLNTIEQMYQKKYTRLPFNYSAERLSAELSYICYENKLADINSIYEHLQEAWPFLDDLDTFKSYEKELWLKWLESSQLLTKVIDKANNDKLKITLYFDNYTQVIYDQLNQEEKDCYFKLQTELISATKNIADIAKETSDKNELLEYCSSKNAFCHVLLKDAINNRKNDIEVKLDYIVPIADAKYYSTKDDDIYYRYGYDLFGPVVLRYIEWLIKQYQDGVFKTIYFFSRDGYLFKKIYDALCEKLGIVQHSHYLYISKRATRLLSLSNEVTDSFLEDAFEYESIDKKSISTAFSRVGISADNYPDIINKHGFANKDALIDLTKDKVKLWSLLKDSAVANDVIANAQHEKKLAKAYLEQEEFFMHDSVAIMDFICRGTIHVRLVDFVKQFKDIDIISLNFATTINAKPKCDKGYKLYGYYATNGVPYQRISILTSMVGLLEAIFAAPHRSVKRYQQKDGKIVAEYKTDSIVYFDLTGPIQAGVFDYAVAKYENGKLLKYDQPDKCEYFNIFKRLYLYPSRQESKYLGELEVDDFTAITKIASPLPLWKYFLARKEALFHYHETPWKRAYLVNLLGTWVTSKRFDKTSKYFKNILK